jgi:hypothetical protein
MIQLLPRREAAAINGVDGRCSIVEAALLPMASRFEPAANFTPPSNSQLAFSIANRLPHHSLNLEA